MAFNIALSGLNAAQTDLDVKGNNIANASTTGFKRSRAEFGDLYSSGLQNLGDTSAGDGVSVQNTRQLFQQGNITATSNGLDMAIDGEGFFVLESPNGERQFSRAGQFGVDENGFVTNNQGARVQGFQATDDGQVGDVRGDLEVNTENLAPKSTTNVAANLNLDSREQVLEERFFTFTSGGTEVGTAVAASGSSADLPETTWDISRPDSPSIDVTTNAGSAESVASQLNQQEGFRVSASNTTFITNDSTSFTDGDQLTLAAGAEEVTYTFGSGEDLQSLSDKINNTSPQGVTAKYDVNGNGEITLTQENGKNLEFSVSGSGSSSLSIEGANGAASGSGFETASSGNPVTTRGVLDFEIDEGYDIAPDSSAGATDAIVDGTETRNFPDPLNEFAPGDPNTYNHSTSTTIYDSLGNPHEMTQYFVKEDPASNAWKSYIEIDGELVGNTSENPDGEEGFDLVFQNNGSLDAAASDEVLINDWVPKDQDGNPNGAAGPNTGLTDPPLPPDSNSSNFVVDYANTTQVGSEFAVNDLQQNGFATGRLTGLDVSEEGVIQARFSNGESEALGQIALANFRNNEGLAPVGDTAWVETIDSGDAVISRPNTGPLGAIQSSSVEESNVDLSEQLVGLITAQRNFQANSKTIETSDQITQTIINLR